MKQDHSAFSNTEQNPRNPASRQSAPVPEPLPQKSNQRHADRPREFGILDILANDLPVRRI